MKKTFNDLDIRFNEEGNGWFECMICYGDTKISPKVVENMSEATDLDCGCCGRVFTFYPEEKFMSYLE